MTKPSNHTKNAALVLGMHRSGTSCFTRCLNILGYSVPSTLIGIDDSNKSGHWESRKIARLNDTILAKLNLTWSSWDIANLDLLRREDLNNFKADILSTLKSEFKKTDTIVVKEPRICRFSNLYVEALEQLDYNTHTFMIIRNPLEVIDSLSNRNNISKSDGAFLWLRYNLDAEYASRNAKSPRVFLDFHQLIESPVETFTSLEAKLSLEYPQALKDVSQRLVDFVSPSEKNHRYSVEHVSHDELTRDWIEDAYSALLILCNNPNSKGSFETLDRIRAEFDIASPHMLKMIKSKNQTHKETLEELNLQISKQEKNVNKLSAAFEKTDKELSDTQQMLSIAKSNESKSTSKLRDTENLLNKKNTSIEVLERELSAVQNALSTTKSKNEKLRDIESQLEQRNASLKALKLELGTVQSTLSITKSKNEKLRDIESQLEQRNASLKALKTELGTVQSTLSITKSKNEKLRDIESQLEQRNASLKALKVEFSALQNALSVSKSDNNRRREIERRLDEKNKSYKALEIKLSEVNKALAISDSRNNELASEILKIENLQQENALLLKTKEQELNALQGLKLKLVSQKSKRKDAEKLLEKINLKLKNTTANATELEKKLSASEQELSDANEKLIQVEGESNQLEATLEARGREYGKLKSAAKTLEVNLNKSKQAFNELENHHKSKIKILSDTKSELQKLTDKAKELRKLNRDLQKDKWNLQDQVRFYKDQVEAYHNSTSWRITAPIRGIKNILRSIKHSLLNIKTPQKLNNFSDYKKQNSEDLISEKLDESFPEMSDKDNLNLIKQSKLFDANFYSTQYPDLINNETQPLDHYYFHGWKEGCNPSATFNTLAYIAANPSIKGSSNCPLVHFIVNNKNLIQNFNTSNENRNNDFGKIVVFTALAGEYDELKPPLQISENVDYVYFSEKEIPGLSVWKHRPFDYFDFEPSRTARFVKTHPHIYFKNYDWAIWIDANIQLNCMPEDLIHDHNDKNNLILFEHPYRDCIYQEGHECIKRNKDTSNLLSEQLKRYERANFPAHAGLYETGVSIFKPKDTVTIELMNIWWREILMGSKRDQVALPIALKESNAKAGQMSNPGICVRTDPRFIYFSHL